MPKAPSARVLLILAILGFLVIAAGAQNLDELKNRAVAGDAAAQAKLGDAYFFGKGTPKDYAQAVRWYRKAAEQGNADGQENLGVCYELGWGVTQDAQEAVRWYRKAAEQGNASGEISLASNYLNGVGVARDHAEALRWYRKAADQGNASGQVGVGYMYENGYGVTQDAAEAVRWYRKAAERGDATGQANLGNMYQDGRGVARDYQEALRWYRKSAAQGNAVGLYNLGTLYESGLGVETDQSVAAYWYGIAAEKGLQQAKSSLAKLLAAGIKPRAPADASGDTAEAKVAKPRTDTAAARLTGSRVPVENIDTPRPAGARNGHAYALIIGAENYRAPIPQVPFAINDAAVVKDYFISTLGVPAEHISGVADPNLTDLRVAVSWLSNQAKADADSDPLLLVYYAGHGVPDIATGKPYLLPVDARPEYIKETGYPIDTLIAELGAMPGRAVLILDACFSGTAARSSESNAGLMGGKRPAFIAAELPRSPKVLVLSAVTGGQTSNALPDAQHGLFTYFLLKGLRGEAANTQGQITVAGLHKYIDKEVSAAAIRMNQVQTPTLTVGADLVLVKGK